MPIAQTRPMPSGVLTSQPTTAVIAGVIASA